MAGRWDVRETGRGARSGASTQGEAVRRRGRLLAVALLLWPLAPSLAGSSPIDTDKRDDPAGPAGPASSQPRPFEIQGHRGAGGLAPENSRSAFEMGIALGVDTLEIDAQSTSDRVLVVYHDQKIDGARCRRADGAALRSKLLVELTLEEVRAIRCAEGAAIPTLEEVLDIARAAPYPVRANVEIKMQNRSRGIAVGEFAALLVDVIDASGMRGRVLVQSFDAESLRAMRRIAPDIPRAVIARDRGTYIAVVEDTTASALLPRRDRFVRADVDALHARGVAVIPWVVDDPEEIRRFRSWGVDGVITNRPDIALEIRDGVARRLSDAETSPPPPTPWPPPLPTSAGEPPAPISQGVVPRAYGVSEVRKVAVYYFTSEGKTDTYLTSLFLEELRPRHVHELIDPYQLADQPRDGSPYHPAGMLDALFREAGEHSAQAIIVGVGRWYGRAGRGFRLEVRLIEVRGGKVLWQATGASGRALSGPSAKREVVREVLRSYPGIRKR